MDNVVVKSLLDSFISYPPVKTLHRLWSRQARSGRRVGVPALQRNNIKLQSKLRYKSNKIMMYSNFLIRKLRDPMKLDREEREEIFEIL